MLRASHIRPWRDSSNGERLDPSNGLLLAAHLDALFDSHLITFDDSGNLLVARKITTNVISVLRLPLQFRMNLLPAEAGYLKAHRVRARSLHGEFDL